MRSGLADGYVLRVRRRVGGGPRAGLDVDVVKGEEPEVVEAALPRMQAQRRPESQGTQCGVAMKSGYFFPPLGGFSDPRTRMAWTLTGASSGPLQ